MRIHSPYPASWALAQRIGYLYSEGEIIYLADTPFERLLDIQRQVGQCQTMTSLSQADFEARLEAVFHQNTGESQQIAQDIDQSVDLLSLSEEMPANEDLLNEDSAAPVNQLQSQDSFGEENTSSSGKELINGEEWNWRSDIHSSKDGTLLERTITVTLPSGQTTSLTRYQSIDNKSGQAQDD